MSFQLDTSEQVYSPDPSSQVGSGVQTRYKAMDGVELLCIFPYIFWSKGKKCVCSQWQEHMSTGDCESRNTGIRNGNTAQEIEAGSTVIQLINVLRFGYTASVMEYVAV